MEPYSSDDIKRKRRKNHFEKPTGTDSERAFAIIVSPEGFLIASRLPEGIDETRIASLTVALYSLSERAIIELKKGVFDHLHIKGSNGYLFVMKFGPNAILITSTTTYDFISKEEVMIKIADDLLNKLPRAISEKKPKWTMVTEGLPNPFTLSQGVDKTRISAMNAALLSLSERTIIEIGKGDFEELYIKGSEGTLRISNYLENISIAHPPSLAPPIKKEMPKNPKS